MRIKLIRNEICSDWESCKSFFILSDKVFLEQMFLSDMLDQNSITFFKSNQKLVALMNNFVLCGKVESNFVV